ncbi:MAG: anti-sigma factor [Bacteroidetes bacterium]|nr:anti-sigma factor [Bacteroidota bacterium]
MKKTTWTEDEINRRMGSLKRPEPPDSLWPRIESELRKDQARKTQRFKSRVVHLTESSGFRITSAAAILVLAISVWLYLPGRQTEPELAELPAQTGTGQPAVTMPDESRQVSAIPDPGSKRQIPAERVRHRNPVSQESRIWLPDSIRTRLSSIDELESFVKSNRTKLDPDYWRASKERLSLLDQSIEECKKALRINTLNTAITGYLNRSSGDKLKTLQTLAAYIREISNENTN